MDRSRRTDVALGPLTVGLSARVQSCDPSTRLCQAESSGDLPEALSLGEQSLELFVAATPLAYQQPLLRPICNGVGRELVQVSTGCRRRLRLRGGLRGGFRHGLAYFEKLGGAVGLRSGREENHDAQRLIVGPGTND